jgi:ABC-type Fe3+-hydroxamate transport system substrate-binding protein
LCIPAQAQPRISVLENIPDLTADQILAFVDGDDAQKRYTELTENSLWQRVPAVRDGKVFVVPSGLYYRGDDGPLGSVRVIEDILQKLADETLGAPIPTPDPAALQVLEETGEYRLIKHSLGETRVPLQPQRVVTLQDQNALLPLFELGFRDVVGSVGAVQPDGSTYFRRMQNYDTANVVYVGEYGTPNLEQIAALKPDLIVGSQYEVTAENYDLLSAIAPTVAVEQFTRPIWSHYDDFALLVNKTEEAQSLKARFDARLADVKAKLPISRLIRRGSRHRRCSSRSASTGRSSASTSHLNVGVWRCWRSPCSAESGRNCSPRRRCASSSTPWLAVARRGRSWWPPRCSSAWRCSHRCSAWPRAIWGRSSAGRRPTPCASNWPVTVSGSTWRSTTRARQAPA